MKNKKIIPIIIGVIVLLGAVSAFAFTRMNSAQPVEETETKKKKTVLEPKNIIDVAMRPYVTLTPVTGGNYIDIAVVDVKKPATEVEYELEYQSGTLLQGFQEVLSLDTLPASTQKLFGSQSAGGAITYHEDIKGGSLQLRFIGEENYVLKQDWKYYENTEDETVFTSKDAKFKVESDDLASNSLVIVYNTPGVPEGLEKELVSEPYSLTSNTALDGEGVISIRGNGEEGAMMMAYDGEAWVELESTTEGSVVTAEAAPLYELYVLVL